MIRHYARERVFEAGDVMRVNLFPVRKVGRGRGAKRMPSRACQVALNHRNSVRLRQEIVQLNFPREVGGLCGRFDYARFWEEFGRNPNESEYKAYMAQFVRRLRALYVKHGGELKIVKFTHLGRVRGRTHHHMIFSTPPVGVMREDIEALWEVGYCNIRKLQYVNGSVENLVQYVSDGSGECKWSCSRNCKRPSKEPYADGTPASVHYIDGHVTMADAHYIDGHADDHAYIKRLFPGWEVKNVRVTAEMGADGEGQVCTLLPFGGPFVEIELYREEVKQRPLRRLGKGGMV